MKFAMRCVGVVGAYSLSLFVFSCGENKSVDSTAREGLAAPQSGVQANGNKEYIHPPVGAKAAAGAAGDPATPPRDAQFTIVCKVIAGPGHVEQARQLKEELIKFTGMKGWYVNHGEGQSTLYYGYYKTLDDPKYMADRQRIASFQDQMGNRPFSGALPGPVNAPDPSAPPELNLVNARGFWSLQIAAYQGTGRKEYAVEAVKEARKMGVEAYYFHGPNISSVCIGAWPEQAIRKQEFDGGGGMDPSDQTRPLLVLGPGAEIPQAIKEQYSKNLVDKESGRQVQVVEQKVDVIDPTMRKAMSDYPTHSVNGEEEVTEVTDNKTGKKYLDKKPSMIVPIPHVATVLQSDPTFAAPSMLAPQMSPASGSGRLRAVGP